MFNIGHIIMINIENNNQEPVQEQKNNQEDDQPDEHGGIYLQGFLRIHDPETGEIILQGRA